MNINRINIFLFSMLLLPMELWAGVVSNQSDNDNNSTQFVLKGKLDVRIPFTMRLRNNGKTIEGTAHYDNQSSNTARSIKGSVDENDEVTLNEYEGKKRIGTYKGILRSDVFLGIFTNVDGKTFAFSSKIVDGEMPANGLDSNQFETSTYIFKKDQNDVHLKLRVDYPVNGNVDLVVETRLFICSEIESAFDVNIAYSDLFDGQTLVNNVGKNRYHIMRQEVIDSIAGPGYTDILEIKRSYENNKYVSFTIHNSYSLGGIGMYYFRSGVSFRKEDGNVISIIKDSDFHDSELQLILIEAVKRKLGENYDLVNDEVFESSPMPTKPPHLTKNGVQFDYQSEEIGAKVLGAMSVIIPYEDIKPFMTDEARLLIE